MLVYNNSKVVVNGGSTQSDLVAFNSSAASVVSGTISGAFIAENNSIITLAGGSVSSNLDAQNNSTANVFSGNIAGNLQIYDDATLNISGGTINGSWYIYGNGILNAFGTGLSDTLINPNSSGFRQFTLSGRLSDGTDVTGTSLYIQNGGSGEVTFIPTAVPEPDSVALLLSGMMGAGFAFRRRNMK